MVYYGSEERADVPSAQVFRAIGSVPKLEELPERSTTDTLQVAVGLGGVCGTDVHLIHGRLPIPRPIVLGHEGVGTVEHVGADFRGASAGGAFTVGDRVTWASNIVCGACEHCTVRGQETLCPARRIYGINQSLDGAPQPSGSWSTRILLQSGSTVARMPDDVSDAAAIALGCAGPTVVHGLRHTVLEQGASVLIQGAGPVGYAAAMFARLAGAGRVTMFGGPESRLEQAVRLGIANETVNIFEHDHQDRCRTTRSGGGDDSTFDLVIECTGIPSAVAEGIDYCRRGGSYLVLGQYTDNGDTTFNPHLITRKQLRINGSWAYGPRDFLAYVDALPRLVQMFDVESLVRIFDLADLQDALDAVAAGTCVKAALAPPHVSVG